MALPAGTKASAGESCPQGGIWHPVGNPTQSRIFGVGIRMPKTPKGETHWVLRTQSGS